MTAYWSTKYCEEVWTCQVQLGLSGLFFLAHQWSELVILDIPSLTVLSEPVKLLTGRQISAQNCCSIQCQDIKGCANYKYKDLKIGAMCMLFLYINKHAEPGEYEVILASNRDEYYNRPTIPAAFLRDHPQCIAGLDGQPGRPPGGTWLGLSNKGRIGVLLNILQPVLFMDKKGRGHLVNDFITSDVKAETLLSELEQQRDQYNEFQLVLLEKTDAWRLSYFSTWGDNIESLDEDVVCLANSPLNHPWKKTLAGKDRFTSVVKEFHKESQREDLERHLLSMLRDTTSYMPDPLISKQAGSRLSEQLQHERAAIFVDSPEIMYGTRTNTLIFIGKDGHGKFIEHTMREPIKLENIQWDVTSLDFKLEPEQIPDPHTKSKEAKI